MHHLLTLYILTSQCSVVYASSRTSSSKSLFPISAFRTRSKPGGRSRKGQKKEKHFFLQCWFHKERVNQFGKSSTNGNVISQPEVCLEKRHQVVRTNEVLPWLRSSPGWCLAKSTEATTSKRQGADFPAPPFLRIATQRPLCYTSNPPMDQKRTHQKSKACIHFRYCL